MTDAVNLTCPDHQNRRDCPDAVVEYVPMFDEYGLVIHDGGSSVIAIKFCPWCGTVLPDSKRDRWFRELAYLGMTDPWRQEIPAQYQSDAWWHARPGQPDLFAYGDFEDLVRDELKSLTDAGFETRVVHERLFTQVIFLKDELRIECSYEPFGPPLCWLAQAGWSGLAVAGSSKLFAEGERCSAAERLAAGDDTLELWRQHDADLRTFCRRVLSELHRTGIVAAAH